MDSEQNISNKNSSIIKSTDSGSNSLRKYVEPESITSGQDDKDSAFQNPDDIFRCVQCGECCTGFGGTYITDDDIIRISEYTHTDPTNFRSEFCCKSGSKYVLRQSKTGECIFFDKEKLCTIHPVKPQMCKNWPFIPTLVNNPENWDIMANSCPGMKKNIPYDAIKRIVSVEIRRKQKF